MFRFLRLGTLGARGGFIGMFKAIASGMLGTSNIPGGGLPECQAASQDSRPLPVVLPAERPQALVVAVPLPHSRPSSDWLPVLAWCWPPVPSRSR